MSASIIDPYLRAAIGSFVDKRNGDMHGDSVKSKQTISTTGPYQLPTSIYMIYIAQKGTSFDVRRMYDYGIDPNNIDSIEQRLLVEARGPAPAATYAGQSYEGMHWRFPCFLSIVIDIADWEVNSSTVAGDDPIIFREYKQNESGPFAENHAFYNAAVRNISYVDGAVTKQCSSVRCINFLTGKGGIVLTNPRMKRFYSFDICVLVPQQGGPKVPHFIDPDGQNQGPPGVP